MTRTRVVWWLFGALSMLLLLIVALVVFLWKVSEPADEGNTQTPSASPSATRTAPPPDDLAVDEVWIGDLDLQSELVVLPDSTLHDVVAKGHGARSGPDGLVVDRLEVEATVPFAEVATQLGGDSTVRAADNGEAAVERSVEAFGRRFNVVATGTVGVKEGLLVVEPRSIDIGGPRLLSRTLGTLVRELVTIEQPIEGLPPKLELRDVDVRSDGFRASLSGDDVVLAAAGS